MSLLLLSDDATTGPLDLVSGSAAAYGLRRLRSGYAGALVNIRRSSDNAQRDFLPLSNGSFPAAAFTAFIGGGSGFVTKWYDQSGAGLDAIQATAATQPAITLTGPGSRAVIAWNGSNHLDNATGFVANPFTACFVANRPTPSAGTMGVAATNGSNVDIIYLSNASPNLVAMEGPTRVSAAATDASWHAVQCVFNGASSVLGVDGVNSTVNAGASGATGALRIGADAFSNGLNGSMPEIIFWPTALSTAALAAINANQHAYWGF